MLEYAFHNYYFIIDVIIRDGDIKIQAVIEHPERGARGQVLNSYKGKLDEEITMPYRIEDPYNQVKVVTKYLFSIFHYENVQQFGCTNADPFWIKKDCGCIININRMGRGGQLREESKISLEHVFKYIKYFSGEWWFNTIASVGCASHQERKWGAGEKLDGFDDERLSMGKR